MADKSVKEPPLRIDGDADRYKQDDSDSDYVQPHALFNMFDKAQKDRLFNNYAAAMGPCSDSVKERWLKALARVDQAFADGVRKVLENIDSDTNAVQVTDETVPKA